MSDKREKILSISIKDCEVQTYRGSGAGGQHRNKTDSAVRVIHHPSDARGESQEQRSQFQNKKQAFLRMIETPKFKYWLHAVANNLKTQKELEDEVEKQTTSEFVKTEIKESGKWVEADPDSLV